MKRSALKRRTALRRGRPLKAKGKSLFPKRRDDATGAYADWIRSQLCMIQGYGFHQCKGRVQAAHVKSRGAGGADLGNLIPLCAWAHSQQHTWGTLTFQVCYGVELLSRAADYYARYLTEHGAP